MSAEEMNVRVGAETEGLAAGMEGAASTTERNSARMAAALERMSAESRAAVQGMQSQLSSSMSQISATIGKVTSIMGLMGAVLVGGAAFKSVIGETGKWTGEAVKLSKALGITTEAASVLNLALGDTYNSMDTMLTGSNLITKQLKANEKAFKDLHVETRDGQGNYRNTLDIMTDVNEALKHTKEGTDRNVAGMSVYGRGWREVQGLMKLNKEVMEDARKKAEELHLIVGPEGVKQMKQYKAAMNDVEDVAMSAKVQIGNAVLPAFVQLGAWFGAIGPQAIAIFEGALKGVITFIQFLGLGAVTTFEIVKAGMQQLVTYAMAAASALGKLLKGDLSGAAEDLKKGWAEGGAIGGRAFDNITKAANATNESLAKMWGLKKAAIGKDKPDAAPGGGHFDAAKNAEKDKSQIPAFKAELEAKKLIEDAFLASSLKDDLAFWEQKKKAGHLSADDAKAVDHEILTLKKEIRKEDLANDLEAIKIRMERERAGSQERADIWDEGVKKIADAYGRDSKEYKSALLEKEKLAREHAKLLEALADSATDTNREIARIGLEMEADAAAHALSIGAISAAEEIRISRDLANRKGSIEIAAINEKLAREKEGTLEYQKLLGQIEIAQAKHAQRIAAIDRKAAGETKRSFEDVFSGVQSTFSQSVQGMIAGTTKLASAIRNIANQILGNFVGMGVKMVTDWLKKQVAMTTITSAQEAARTTVTTTAETARTSISTAGAMTQITANAASAASGAASSQAAIPIVGPALGAAAAMAMLALVLGLGGGIKSAAGGWDRIDRDQVAQVHKDEMILPAELAEGVRQGAAGGASKNQGASSPIYISAVDARGVKRLLSDNGGAVAGALQKQARNFSGVNVKGRRT